jgi:hypothetical protein
MPEKVSPESQPNKWRELLEELRTVFTGRNSFFDAILPPIIFLVINGLVSFKTAMWSALALSVVIAIFRVSRKQSVLYALAGVGSVAVAIGIAWFLGKSEGFFLPGLISGSMTLLLTIVSLDYPSPHGGMDKLHRTPLAFGLVLASASPPSL